MSDRSKQLLVGSIWNRKSTDLCCPGSGGGGLAAINGTDCIGVSGTGAISNPITIFPIISPTAFNILTCSPSGLYVNAVQSVIEGTGVSIDNTDPQNPIVSSSFDPALIKTLQDRSLKTYFSLPKNFETEGILHLTKNGALASVTPTQIGAYDQYAITGGDQTSYITFDDHILTDSASKIVATLRVDALGAAPRMGIRIKANASYCRLAVAGDAITYLKQNLSVTNGVIATGIYGDFVNYNTGGTPFAINNGDIVEITMKRYLLEKQGWEFVVVNKSTGNFLTRQQFGVNGSNVENSAANVGLILADGTYTILDYQIISQDGEGAKCCILSSSLGIGWNITYGNSIVNQLNNKLLYRNIALGGSFTDMNGFARGSVVELLILKPEAVVIMDNNAIITQWFDNTNPGNANYVAKLHALVDCIHSYGGLPIFVKYKPVLGGTTSTVINLWNTWVDTNSGIYGAVVLDLNRVGDMTQVFDGIGAGYAMPYTGYIADRIIELLTTNGLL